jgi:UDP-N-acetylglucosamine--N-acetylmuramyl-(pentapeptide) pyrophosphoryl-undecaprenol N-acetylglucosamine transferase
LIIHEQNRIPGTTNRLLARLANQVLEAFPGSFGDKVKAKCTGNPLRKSFLSALEKVRRQSEKEVRILIFGGS